MKYTWNIFRNKIKEMGMNEKQDLLNELHAELMTARTREEKAPTKDNRINILRKQIACLKTNMHVPGYHYHPRG